MTTATPAATQSTLHLQPTAWDREFAQWIYERYTRKEGSGHIASDRALVYLSACLRMFRPKRVMELGAGIGTMTDAILSHPQRPELLFTTEKNEFCQEQLRRNLSQHDSDRWRMLTTPDEVVEAEIDRNIDLYVGDGGFKIAAEMSGANLGTVFFAEGQRRTLRALFQECLDEEWTIDWTEYGVEHQWGLRSRTALKVPVPGRIRLKGCWIGQVRSRP